LRLFFTCTNTSVDGVFCCTKHVHYTLV
jgi:hypothetical protein